MSPAMCPACGNSNVTQRHPERYHYIECGLEDVYLLGSGVTETVCSDCGETYVSIIQEWQLLQVIAMDLLMKRGLLIGQEMRYLRKACLLTQDALAKKLIVTRQTISERESRLTRAIGFEADFTLRAVLIGTFEEVVCNPEYSHLTESHLTQLRRYASSLDEAANALSGHRSTSKGAVNPTFGRGQWNLQRAA